MADLSHQTVTESQQDKDTNPGAPPMSNNNSSTSSNSSFSHAFLPGLILGLIVGAVAGAFLPDFLSGSKLPNFQTTPGQVSPEARNGDPRSAPNEYDEETQKLIDEAMKVGEDAKDDLQDDAQDIIDDLEKDASEITPPTTVPSDG